ncbi:phosphoribosylanthranilate isomerase [Oceanobacillus sp. FSL K6-2867]|uniref:phosphoribosylanthranilate isomerase n=1 Tax=Oceanobacillus sp. FSL K6-2867 TaxID=2954748 RepID=UPI0030DCD4E1
MIVKICGITTKEAAAAAVKSGADYIGFVFARSSRQISPEEAAIIANSIPSSIKKVGVFVNEAAETMKEIAQMVGLNTIQLHGDEPPAIAQQLPYEIIKAFPVNKNTLTSIRTYPCDYYLLDSLVDSRRGGSGIAFDWSLADQLSINREKIMLAGGLTPDNVAKAISTVRPAAVDVSSGVETNKEKDLNKIEKFIKNAKTKERVS